MENQGEIILYQPDSEVRLDDETVWLTQAQMAQLFQTTKQNVSLHTNNIFKENELERASVVKECFTTAADGKNYRVKYYNLDVIISVGYRVRSVRGTQFRQWANKVLKEYLLRGYSVNRRLTELEHTVAEHSRKIDFFVRTSLPPVEGVFYDGQIFDAYKFAADPDTLGQEINRAHRQLRGRLRAGDAHQAVRRRNGGGVHSAHKPAAAPRHRQAQQPVPAHRSGHVLRRARPLYHNRRCRRLPHWRFAERLGQKDVRLLQARHSAGGDYE